MTFICFRIYSCAFNVHSSDPITGSPSFDYICHARNWIWQQDIPGWCYLLSNECWHGQFLAFQTRKVIKLSEMLLSVHAEVNELLEGSSERLWCFVGRLLTGRSDWAKAANDAERSLLRVLHSIWKCNVDRHLPSISFKFVSYLTRCPYRSGLVPSLVQTG